MTGLSWRGGTTEIWLSGGVRVRLGEALPALSFVSAYQECVVVGTFWNALHT